MRVLNTHLIYLETKFNTMKVCLFTFLIIFFRNHSVWNPQKRHKRSKFLLNISTAIPGERLPHWPEDVEAEEGVWRDYYTGHPLANYTRPWRKGDGALEGSHCLGLLTWWPKHDWVIQFDESWWETGCEGKAWRGCPCQSQELPPVLWLRGLCPSSIFRTKDPSIGLRFTPRQLPDRLREVFFIGGMSTRIVFSHGAGDSQWSVGDHSGWAIADSVANLTAVTTARKDGFVLGKHRWTVAGDNPNCEGGGNYTMLLKFTGCREGEFTCDDGQCVRMEERCDQLPDCRDKSDEAGCKLLVLEEGYNRRVPPITAASATDRTIVPVLVNISIVLMEVVSMDEVDHSIELQFEIILNWKENRAAYLNLKQKTALNKMTDEDIKRLWLPLIIYTNTDQKRTTRLGMDWEWSTTVTVTREANFTRAGLDNIDETEIFEGSENRLTMRQTYTHRFQCNYQLMSYPFDTQVGP